MQTANEAESLPIAWLVEKVVLKLNPLWKPAIKGAHYRNHNRRKLKLASK
jgi:hypothetical protein